MASWTRRAVVLGVVACAGGVVASACADNQQSLFIRQVQGPASGQCSYSNDPTSLALGFGVMDLALSSKYRAALLVGNQMVQRGSAEMARAESSRVQLDEAEVHVLVNEQEVNAFTVPGTGFADPSSGTEPGWGVFMTELIDAETSNRLVGILQQASGGQTGRLSTVARAVAVVKVYGHTLGGKDVESGDFTFPVEVCYGCLVSFPVARSTDLNNPNCANCAEATDISEPCLLGQDQPVDCCLCKQYLGSMGQQLCEP